MNKSRKEKKDPNRIQSHGWKCVVFGVLVLVLATAIPRPVQSAPMVAPLLSQWWGGGGSGEGGDDNIPETDASTTPSEGWVPAAAASGWSTLTNQVAAASLPLVSSMYDYWITQVGRVIAGEDDNIDAETDDGVGDDETDNDEIPVPRRIHDYHDDHQNDLLEPLLINPHLPPDEIPASDDVEGDAFSPTPARLRDGRTVDHESDTDSQESLSELPHSDQSLVEFGDHGITAESNATRTVVLEGVINRYIDLLALSSSSYCADSIASGQWNCTPCQEWPSPDRLDASLLRPLGGPVKAFGYMIPSADHRTIYISFRGTITWNNLYITEKWISDLEISKTNYSLPILPPACKVHYGFYYTFTVMQADLDVGLHEYFAQFDNPSSLSFVVLGHSLGGAVAPIGALHLIHEFDIPASSISVVTLNAPRIGNYEFAQAINALNLKEYTRIVNYHDWVPHLPPRYSGFYHAGVELWISELEPNNGTLAKSYQCPSQELTSSLLNHGSVMENVDGMILSASKVRASHAQETESTECSNALNPFYTWRASHGYAWTRRVGHDVCRTTEPVAVRDDFVQHQGLHVDDAEEEAEIDEGLLSSNHIIPFDDERVIMVNNKASGSGSEDDDFVQMSRPRADSFSAASPSSLVRKSSEPVAAAISTSGTSSSRGGWGGWWWKGRSKLVPMRAPTPPISPMSKQDDAGME